MASCANLYTAPCTKLGESLVCIGAGGFAAKLLFKYVDESVNKSAADVTSLFKLFVK